MVENTLSAHAAVLLSSGVENLSAMVKEEVEGPRTVRKSMMQASLTTLGVMSALRIIAQSAYEAASTCLFKVEGALCVKWLF